MRRWIISGTSILANSATGQSLVPRPNGTEVYGGGADLDEVALNRDGSKFSGLNVRNNPNTPVLDLLCSVGV